MSLQAFHHDPAEKARLIAQVAAHRLAGELIKGVYWEMGKGCAGGCMIHSADYADYPRLVGLPVSLAFLQDTIFEHLPHAQSQRWPERFLEAIPVGADTMWIPSQIMEWLLADPVQGMVGFVRTKDAHQIIAYVTALMHHRRLVEENPLGVDEPAMAQAAKVAAEWAAKAMAWEAWAKESKAVEWKASKAWEGAGEKAWATIADKLITLLEKTHA